MQFISRADIDVRYEFWSEFITGPLIYSHNPEANGFFVCDWLRLNALRTIVFCLWLYSSIRTFYEDFPVNNLRVKMVSSVKIVLS